MDKNKTVNYFKYAIGEIVLVVIGILIALQINNWNENRKLSIDIQNILSSFEKELETNIKSSNSLIRWGYSIDSSLTLYDNNQIAREGFQNHSRMLLFAMSMQKFIHDNLDALIEQEKQLSKKYITLIPDLKELKRRIESQRQWEQTVSDLRLSRTKEMVDELPFYNWSDSILREKTINYILTNPSHKNKISHYYDYELNENIWDATLIRTSSVALLWKIKSIREEDQISIESFLNNLGLTPFQEFECGEQFFEENEGINFRSNFIIYNNTNTAVYYNHLNKKGEILNTEKISLPPKSFRLNEFWLRGDSFIEVLENGTCKKVYRRTKADYLVLE